MEKETATAIMDKMLELNAFFNRTSELTIEIHDIEERLEIRTKIGKLMADIFTEIMLPIIRQYPELDPDRDDGVTQ